MGFPFVKGLRLAEGVGNAPTSAMPILFSRQVQPAYICLPSRNGGRALAPARVGLAPTPNGLTGRRATFTPPGNKVDWRCRQDSHPHCSD